MLHWMLDDLYPEMPWEKIDTVVFDVGNVLLSFSPEDLIREYLPELSPEEAAYFRRKVFQSPYWTMLDRGTLSYEDAVTVMAARDEDLKPLIKRMLDSWVDLKHPVEEGVRTLKNARAHGKRCIVLSNYHEASFELVRNKFDFFRLFDGFVVSARQRLLKPGHEIYQYTLDRFGLDRSRTLFIDDAPANIEACLHEGWQGICYNDPGKLDRFFGNPAE